VERKTGELVLLAPKVKAEPAKPAPKPIKVATGPTKAKTASASTRRKKARQRKTLRLMQESHQALCTLAREKGVTQQSLMESAVETLLQQECAGTAKH
jgi:predicted RNase H-like nuclease